jgi:dihydrofolate reductase
MGKIVLGMTMSLDGFINDRCGGVSSLYPDLAALGKTDASQQAIRETGAVVMGRRAYAMGDPDAYADAYEFQVPIFVLTHAIPETPPKENEYLTFTFVTDGIASAIAQAREAAGDKDVMVVGGAATFRECIRAGLFDEIHIGIMPVLLGDGLRLFERSDGEQVNLTIQRVFETVGRIDIRFRAAT